MIVLVEGVSDAAAVRAAAHLLGRDLESVGVEVLSVGGVTNFRKHLVELGPLGRRMPVAGLYDAGEERHVVRGLDAAGFGSPAGAEIAALGFFVCRRDLEDELIRALGSDKVLDVLDRNGDLDRFRTFQRQPEKRAESIETQLHRFFGTTSGRKERYGRILVEALDPAKIPRPLTDLLNFVTNSQT